MSTGRVAAILSLALAATCREAPRETVVTFPGSAVGAEGELLTRQVERFMAEHPGIRVVLQPTPDDATQRHQIYVQRLNARSTDPDVLQLDVIWTPEFAAAGWLLPLDRFGPEASAYWPAAVAANTWDGHLYAIPWFVDVGMLYWRIDLLDSAPATFDALIADARRVTETGGPVRGIVWQGARYEGLVTVFLEFLGGFGGEILTADGEVAVDSPAAVRALQHMHDEIWRWEIAPREVLTWHEEEARFAFQNGTAVFMRNWPYAYALMNSRESRVTGRFAVGPMPTGPGGRPTAALGGSQLGVNAHSDAPEAAWTLIEWLTAPERMLERARVAGQLPARPALFDDPRLEAALAMPVDPARSILESAVTRPVLPIWPQLSEILQIELHRALVRQVEPSEALARAAEAMRRALDETGVRELMERQGTPAAGGRR